MCHTSFLNDDGGTVGADARLMCVFNLIYDADNPTHFDLKKALKQDCRVAKRFILVGLVWVVLFAPFLVNKTLNE